MIFIRNFRQNKYGNLAISFCTYCYCFIRFYNEFLNVKKNNFLSPYSEEKQTSKCDNRKIKVMWIWQQNVPFLYTKKLLNKLHNLYSFLIFLTLSLQFCFCFFIFFYIHNASSFGYKYDSMRERTKYKI